MKEKHIIVGTAGHVDHGKTSLTIALTGIDTDRLPEEKRRGLTIVPGFVPLDLASGRRLGLIDVPGHEQFIRNMMAGASGIDMALLIIAADEGVMPQTVEHLNILSLLGIHKGVVVLTKVDMVDAEWLDMVREDVKKLLAGSSFSTAPLLAVSARTGENIEELKLLLDKVAGEVEERKTTGRSRLPIDRVFHKSGFGTIVTGTLWNGTITLGDSLELLPSSEKVRVRGIQVHGKAVEAAVAGQRTALNITGQGVEKAVVGSWLSAEATIFESHRLDVKLTLLKSARNLSRHSPVRIFHGTKEILGRIRLLDREILQSGENCLCQLEMEEPLATLKGDRIILRSYSPVETIGGAEVLDPKPRRYKLSEKDIIAEIERKAQLDAESLALAEKDKERAEQKENILTVLANYHKAFPLRRGMPLPELRQRVLPKLSAKEGNAVLEGFQKENVFVFLADGLGAMRDFEPRLSSRDKEILEKLEEAFSLNIYSPPVWEEVVQDLKLKQGEAQEYLGWLLDRRKLRKLGNIYFAYGVLEEGEKALKAKYGETFTIGEARDTWKTSRKFAQNILDTLDAQGVTKRQGDSRVFLQ